MSPKLRQRLPFYHWAPSLQVLVLTMMRPMLAKAAAARPPEEPDFIHSRMMSIGFHKTSPYADSAEAAVKIPRRPTTAIMNHVSRIAALRETKGLAY